MPSEETINVTEVLSKLLEALDQNGQLSAKTRDHYLLLALTCLLQVVEPLPRRLSKLESYSIILQAKKHPRITGVLTTIFILVAMFFHQITPWVMLHLALITGFK